MSLERCPIGCVPIVWNNADQVDILKAFPDYRWRALTQRMRYHFGRGWWKSYKGEKKYPRNTTWAGTEEARAKSTGEVQQLMPSEDCTDTCTSPHRTRQYWLPPITTLAA